MKKLYYFFLLVFANILFAQTYKPLDTADYKDRKLFLQNYTKNNEDFTKYIKGKYEGELGRYLSKNYEEFQKEFREKVKGKDFHHKSQFNNYINQLIVKIRNKNPQIPSQLQILIEKDNTPNAASVGDGTVIVNMGLFRILDNEEQVMAVLSHEIAHQILSHSLKYQAKGFIAKKNSKSQTEEIKHSKINRSEKAFKLFKNIIYSNSVERRKNEMQADSLGFALYKSAAAHPVEFKKALVNLQKFDTISPKIVSTEFYSKVFNLPKAPFKESWMKMEDFSTYNYNHYKEKLNKDSISTHPEIDTRIEKLSKLFPSLNEDSTYKENEASEFSTLKKIAQQEVAPNYFYSEDYGLGIYWLLQEHSNGNLNDDIYFKYWLGQYFNKIYLARKDYKLNRYLDRLEPSKQDKSYQQFLSFMWNLSLDDIKNIADYYQQKSS